jgi:formate dehydrogenase alpha subunit
MRAFIDGLLFESDEKVTILEAARRLDRPIPTLCHHPRLEPAAACRLCLVQVEGRREPVPACATTLEDGQRIRTDTPELRRLRRGVLELILSEHPSACLVCAERRECREPKEGIRKTAEPTGCVLCPGDGRCRLQAVVEAIGLERTAFPEAPRAAEPRRDDPLIDRDPGLCILCGLCVRVCRDLRGASVLTMTGRGGRTMVAAALDGTLLASGCRFCGACVDVCPTGALMERAVRHIRPDESKPLLCALCGEGCSLEADFARGRLIGAHPAEGPANRGQACVKGRFLIPDLLEHSDRLTFPLVRRNGALVRVPWEAALAAAAEGWRRTEGPFAAAGSDQDSCEDLRALEGLAREAFGSDRFCVAGAPTPLEAIRSAAGIERGAGWPDVPKADLAAMKAFIVFDEDLAVTAPILGLEVYRSVRTGARLAVFGAHDSCLDRCAKIHVRVGPESSAEILIEVAALLARLADGRDEKDLAAILRAARAGAAKAGGAERMMVEEKSGRIAAMLEKRRPAAFLFGPGFVSGAAGPRNAAALWNLARLAGAALVPIAWGANARGAADLFDKPGPGGKEPAPAGKIFLSVLGGGPPKR